MNAISDEFQSLNNSNSFYIRNIYLNNKFKEFLFYFIIEKNNNIVSELIQERNLHRIIVIDEYIESKSQYHIGEDFFIISFNKIFIIITKTEISLLIPFFCKNKDSTISFISETAKNDIQNLFESKNYDFSSENENQLFLNEINSFTKINSIKIKDKKVNNSLNHFLKFLQNSIAGLMIKKSYINSRYSRFIRKYQKYKKIQNSEYVLNNDQYIILRNISSGILSYINLIYVIELEQLFIMKVFQSDGQELFYRENSNFQDIYHPFIPRYLGTTTYISNKCLIEEYLEGESLLLIKNIYSKEDKIQLIFKIMVIMEYIHYNGFIYRDIKPDNFIVDKNKSVYLIDFGVMIKKSSLEHKSIFTTDFTSIFVAPEIVDGKLFSSKADIYSLGQIIHFLFSGQFPKEYESLNDIYEKCINIDENKRPSISQLIDEFYQNFHETISIISEIDTIFSTKDIHTEKYFHYWIYLTDNENPFYLFQLGKLYETGTYFKQDTNKAIQYYTLSAEIDYCDAQYTLGNIYYVGVYVDRDINKSIKYYTMASGHNHLDAQFQLGIIYFEGKYINQNIDEAFKYFTLAIKQDHEYAHYYLGLIYYEEKYLKQDIKKSIEHFEICAKEGFNQAQYYLGIIYYEGKYVERNIDQAIKYFNDSAKHNNSESLYKLGEIYYENKYIERDIYKSIEYFILSSNQQNVKAQFKLGEIFYENKYIERDINRSIEFFLLAAEQNNAIAQYNLGSIYYSGQFVPQNITLAIVYFTQSAKQNNVLAQYNLGQIYYQGKGIIRDLNKSIDYYTMAAAQNYSEAQNELGAIYYENKFIGKAIHYFNLAANLNHPIAQFNLGLIYLIGKYVQCDIKKSIEYFTLSANQNYLLSQYYLGIIYYEDRYNLKDLNKSVEFFTLAAKNNHLDSYFYLGIIYLDNNYIHRNIEKSIYYYTQAATRGHLKAQYSLGILYYEGNYIPQDIDKSIWYFSLASDQNCSEAQNFLGSIYLEYNKVHSIEKAIYYYTLSSNQNNSNAQFNLGCIYYEKQDIKEAIHYFKLATKGNSDAQNFLGVIYYDNKYIPRDMNKSLYYFKLASKNNNRNAQYNLGLIYYQNKFVPVDINKSIEYFSKAKENMFFKASLYLGYIYHEGRYIKQDIEKSIVFYKEASSFNDQFAKNNLGVIYKNGFGNKIMKNIELSKEYFNEAIKQKDDFIAMFNLSNIYLDEDDKYKSIELLINSSNKGFIPSKVVLFYLLSNELKFVDQQSIKNELQKFNTECNIYAPKIYKWYKEIGQYLFNDLNCYKNAYKYFRENDILYLNGYFVFSDIFDKNSNQNIHDTNMAQIITNDFYEGFDI